MSSKRRRQTRGAATVETTLGILVLVPMVFYAIQITELGIASMKVTEAAAAPLWDTTAYPMHVTGLPPTYRAFRDRALGEAALSAQLRYGLTFDGRMSALQALAASGGAASTVGAPSSEIFTAAGKMQVGCAGSEASTGPALEFSSALVGAVIPETNGVACKARAQAANLIPKLFFNVSQGGFFKEDLNSHWGEAMTLCPVGRADGWGGDCHGALAMLTDDWGLANAEHPLGGTEASACTVTLGTPLMVLPCENKSYYTTALAIFTLHTAPMLNNLPFGLSWAPHRTLVAATVGGTPSMMATDTSFYMAYRGDETFFHTFTPTSDRFLGILFNDRMLWQTTPFSTPPSYGVGYVMRSKCYLGLSGC